MERQFCCFTTHVSTCEPVVRYRAPPDRHSITAKMARWRRDRVSQSDIIFDGSRNTPLARSLARPGSLTPLGVSVWFQSEFGLSREQTHRGGRGFNFARARARSPFFHSFVVVLPSLHGRVNLQFAKDAQRPHASWAKKCAPNCSITLPIALPFENVCRLQCRHYSVHASRS